MMNKPVRILHVVGIMNVGGAETMLMEIYRRLNKDVFQFDFLTHSINEGFFDKEIQELGGRIYTLPKYRGYNHIDYVSSLNNFFKSHDEYKIVHCHIRSTANLVLKVAKKNECKTISHAHGITNGSGIAGCMRNLYKKDISKYSDLNLAVSSQAGKWQFGSQPFTVLINGIDLERFKYDENLRVQTRVEHGISNQNVIGHIGRFVFEKNHQFILKIFSHYLRFEPNSLLLLVGDGELKKQIEKNVLEMKIQDHVIFVGNQADVVPFLNEMDLFLFPSQFEGLGISLIEAQASGLPCLVSDKLPEESLINVEKLEVLKLSTDARIWAKEIHHLLSNNYDRSKALESKDIIKYSIETMKNSLIDLYNKLLIYDVN